VLGTVNVLRDLYELGSGVGRKSCILLRHALDDVGFRVTLVHQLARPLADSGGVRSALIGDAGVVERGQKIRIGARVGLRRRGQADYHGGAHKHYMQQSHCFILVQIGAIVLRRWASKSRSSSPSSHVSRPGFRVKPSRMDTSTFIERLNEDLAGQNACLRQPITDVAVDRGSGEKSFQVVFKDSADTGYVVTFDDDDGEMLQLDLAGGTTVRRSLAAKWESPQSPTPHAES
jgi:hypothetical protein